MCRHRPPPSASSRGFSLIEILVVLVIAAIIMSVAVLSLGALGNDRDVEREGQRMLSLLQLAVDEAELQGRDFGIEFIRQGYRFVEYDPLFETWAELGGDEILRPRSLPEGYEMELFLEDRQVELEFEAAETDDKEEEDSPLLDKYAPHGLILSSGDISPLDVDIIRRFDDTSVRVSVSTEGNIELVVPDDES